MLFDTIVAPITGNQPAAVAIVRLSGPESWTVASKLFSAWPSQPESHRAIYGRLTSGDDCLALPFAEGHSYTGEQSVEFSIHGSPASVQTLVQACVEAGARLARPGEFTERAFLNGRMDLTQAEGVRDTVEAETALQLRAANELRTGALSTKITEVVDRLAGLLASVEASVDFSEEVGEIDIHSTLMVLWQCIEDLKALLQTARAGRILRRGYRVAIVGPPNAGKSSLLNALLGSDRAIVTPVEGTTRDTIEEKADLNGLPVVLIDTAGLRETNDPVESIGVQRTRIAASNADEIWYVFDASQGWSEAHKNAVEEISGTKDIDFIEHAFHEAPFRSNLQKGWIPTRLVANKIDLAGTDPGPDRAVRISALTRVGLDRLIEKTVASALLAPHGLPYVNTRHEAPLQTAREALEHGITTLSNLRPHDLLSVDLRLAISALGEITGETASEDMIERIFRDFCVGK